MAEFEDTNEDNVEELSSEEKLQISQHYLLSSPPGQFNEVLSDVRRIVSADILTDSIAAGTARLVNLKNGAIVSTPSGRKVALHQSAEIDSIHYTDPVDGTSYALNHLSLVTSGSSMESNQDPTLESVRAAVQQAVTKYVKSAYAAENSAGSVYARDGVLTIVISGEKANLRNFWSGKWTSIWTLDISEGSTTLSGDIKIHVHYFEDGNLQLQTTKVVDRTIITFNSEEDMGTKIVNAIKASESTLQNGLEEMYTNMNTETFKSMRRVMPITRTKMDWNVNAVRMVRQVRK